MSKFDEKLELYKEFMTGKSIAFDADLLHAVTKGLGPSIYRTDAETVSGSDATELATVKNNFLIKKLGLEDNEELDTAIEEVIETLGKSERKKYRAVFYYLLVVKFSKQDVYGL